MAVEVAVPRVARINGALASRTETDPTVLETLHAVNPPGQIARACVSFVQLEFCPQNGVEPQVLAEAVSFTGGHGRHRRCHRGRRRSFGCRRRRRGFGCRRGRRRSLFFTDIVALIDDDDHSSVRQPHPGHFILAVRRQANIGKHDDLVPRLGVVGHGLEGITLADDTPFAPALIHRIEHFTHLVGVESELRQGLGTSPGLVLRVSVLEIPHGRGTDMVPVEETIGTTRSVSGLRHRQGCPQQCQCSEEPVLDHLHGLALLRPNWSRAAQPATARQIVSFGWVLPSPVSLAAASEGGDEEADPLRNQTDPPRHHPGYRVDAEIAAGNHPVAHGIFTGEVDSDTAAMLIESGERPGETREVSSVSEHHPIRERCLEGFDHATAIPSPHRDGLGDNRRGHFARNPREQTAMFAVPTADLVDLARKRQSPISTGRENVRGPATIVPSRRKQDGNGRTVRCRHRRKKHGFPLASRRRIEIGPEDSFHCRPARHLHLPFRIGHRVADAALVTIGFEPLVTFVRISDRNDHQLSGLELRGVSRQRLVAPGRVDGVEATDLHRGRCHRCSGFLGQDRSGDQVRGHEDRDDLAKQVLHDLLSY